MAVLAVGGDDVVFRLEYAQGAGGHRLFANIQVQKAANFLLTVQLGRLFLHAADAQHVGQNSLRKCLVPGHRAAGRCWHLKISHAPPSSVEVSPSGRPSSRALSRRRMILPLRVRGKVGRKAISFGATAAPRRLRACAMMSMRSASSGWYPSLSETKALTTSPTIGSGLPITPASATAGCSISTLSTSNGPIRWPADLMTSSARPTNQ